MRTVCGVAKTTVLDTTRNLAKIRAICMHLFESSKHSMNENRNELASGSRIPFFRYSSTSTFMSERIISED